MFEINSKHYIINCYNVTTQYFFFNFLEFLFMKRNYSPCINLCKFSGKKEWCLGCGRTRQECREWKVMKTYKRILLNKKLLRRMLQISNNT